MLFLKNSISVIKTCKFDKNAETNGYQKGSCVILWEIAHSQPNHPLKHLVLFEGADHCMQAACYRGCPNAFTFYPVLQFMQLIPH